MIHLLMLDIPIGLLSGEFGKARSGPMRGPAFAATGVSVGCGGPAIAGFCFGAEVGLWVALVFIDGSSDAFHFIANAVIAARTAPDIVASGSVCGY
jgi:hypothetical protein